GMITSSTHASSLPAKKPAARRGRSTAFRMCSSPDGTKCAQMRDPGRPWPGKALRYRALPGKGVIMWGPG
ncbi:hypothetical protein ACWCSH_41615, partial [Streptosporangium sp. NPDC001682]